MSDIKVNKPTSKDPETALAHRTEFMFPALPFGGGLFSMNPFKMMRRMSEEFDRAFANFPVSAPAHEAWAPAAEIMEKDGKFIVRVEVPGMTKDEVKVDLVEGALVIEGERKHEKEEKAESYFRSERYYGKLYRSIPLPEGVKPELIAATLNNGVLEVTAPVPEKKIEKRAIPIAAK